MPTVEIGGKPVEIRFEMLDWYVAGKALGVKFLPFGTAEFWQGALSDAEGNVDQEKSIETDLTVLYVALRKHFPGLTIEGLAGMIPDTETWYAATRAAQEALTDFFLRAEKAIRANNSAETSQTQ